MKPLDIRDIAIIDAFPVYRFKKTVLNIGCGEGRIDYHLADANYRVYATDMKRDASWQDSEWLTFHEADIFDLASFPVPSASVVICSEVLEHLRRYRDALMHLIALADVKLIITVPYRKSFGSPSHQHFWDDRISNGYKDVNEFVSLCSPYSVSISKIRTKPEDVKMRQYGYLIMVDKRQKYMRSEL